MYEIVTEQTQVPILSSVEGEIDACYQPAGIFTQKLASDPSFVSLPNTHASMKSDQLRHYVTHSDDGYYLDIRFSHDEFDFLNAMSRWLSRIATKELHAFPELAELVVREFRQGIKPENLPISKLRSYADRWEVSFWKTVLAYKKMSRDLYERYQSSLKQWVLEMTP